MICALSSGCEGMDMGKPKIYGMNRGYIPNAKSDMRYRKKIYQRGRETTLRGDKREKEKDGET